MKAFILPQVRLCNGWLSSGLGEEWLIVSFWNFLLTNQQNSKVDSTIKYDKVFFKTLTVWLVGEKKIIMAWFILGCTSHRSPLYHVSKKWLLIYSLRCPQTPSHRWLVLTLYHWNMLVCHPAPFLDKLPSFDPQHVGGFPPKLTCLYLIPTLDSQLLWMGMSHLQWMTSLLGKIFHSWIDKVGGCLKQGSHLQMGLRSLLKKILCI